MKTLNFLIIEAEDAYINTKNGLIVNTSIEDVSRVNRIGKVISAPDFVKVKEGDYVLIHHNVMRKRLDNNGNVIQSDYNIEGNKYFVPLREVFMFKRGGDDWLALEPFCFVKPIEHEDKSEGLFKLSKTEEGYKGFEKNKGILTYPNQDLLDQGLKAGQQIVFSDDSEYEFEIEGELFYKMATRDILMGE